MDCRHTKLQEQFCTASAGLRSRFCHGRQKHKNVGNIFGHLKGGPEGMIAWITGTQNCRSNFAQLQLACEAGFCHGRQKHKNVGNIFGHLKGGPEGMIAWIAGTKKPA